MSENDPLVERTRAELRRASRHGPPLRPRLEARLEARTDTDLDRRRSWRRGTMTTTPLVRRGPRPR